jgi:hypothetical protein
MAQIDIGLGTEDGETEDDAPAGRGGARSRSSAGRSRTRSRSPAGSADSDAPLASRRRGPPPLPRSPSGSPLSHQPSPAMERRRPMQPTAAPPRGYPHACTVAAAPPAQGRAAQGAYLHALMQPPTAPQAANPQLRRYIASPHDRLFGRTSGFQWTVFPTPRGPNLSCPQRRVLSTAEESSKQALQDARFAVVWCELFPSEYCAHHFRTSTDPFQLDAAAAEQLARRVWGIRGEGPSERTCIELCKHLALSLPLCAVDRADWLNSPAGQLFSSTLRQPELSPASRLADGRVLIAHGAHYERVLLRPVLAGYLAFCAGIGFDDVAQGNGGGVNRRICDLIDDMYAAALTAPREQLRPELAARLGFPGAPGAVRPQAPAPQPAQASLPPWAARPPPQARPLQPVPAAPLPPAAARAPPLPPAGMAPPLQPQAVPPPPAPQPHKEPPWAALQQLHGLVAPLLEAPPAPSEAPIQGVDLGPWLASLQPSTPWPPGRLVPAPVANMTPAEAYVAGYNACDAHAGPLRDICARQHERMQAHNRRLADTSGSSWPTTPSTGCGGSRGTLSAPGQGSALCHASDRPPGPPSPDPRKPVSLAAASA